MSEEPQEEEENTTYPITHSAAFAGSTLVTMGLLDVLAHLGPTGLVVGGLVSYVAWKHGPELYEYVREKLPPARRTLPEQAEPATQQPPRRQRRSMLDRALGRFPDAVEEDDDHEQGAEDEPTAWEEAPFLGNEASEAEVSFDLDGEEEEEDDLLLPRSRTQRFLFSSVLDQFHPTLDRIFLARTATGLDLYCSARDLCHVALAGNTGGGKSSIMRMLMLQLCCVGVRVLLLNPHYTRYDLDTDEDWTPFEPFLVSPPMECRSYEVIAHYLKSTATDLIPKRLERRAHSQPVGKPYFLVIDELPSIVREIQGAPA